MLTKLSLITLALVLSGCGQTSHHFITNQATATPVKFQVNLEKPFVSSVSSLGGGQAAMLLLVGPFTNNAVLLVAKESSAASETIAFRERLKWGVNSFEVLLNKNTTYQLVVAVQGTRAGAKDIGTFQVTSDAGQHFTVNLLENEVSIK